MRSTIVKSRQFHRDASSNTEDLNGAQRCRRASPALAADFHCSLTSRLEAARQQIIIDRRGEDKREEDGRREAQCFGSSRNHPTEEYRKNPKKQTLLQATLEQKSSIRIWSRLRLQVGCRQVAQVGLLLALALACCCASGDQQTAPGANNEPAMAGDQQQPVANLAPAEKLPEAQQQTAANISNEKPPEPPLAASTAAESPKETLQTAESEPEVEKYSPPVSQGESSTLSSSDTKSSSIEQQISAEPIVQQQDEVPAVSGLSSQDEPAQQQQQTEPVAVVPTEASSGPPEVASTQQTVDADQQILAAMTPTESDSARLRNSAAENDVLAGGDQFGRKSVVSEQQQQQQPQGNGLQQAAKSANGSKGSRSLKRAFGGHLGVFGRKRTQAEEQAAVGGGGEQAPTSKQPASSRSGREYHYYYHSTTTKSPKGKLKSADYPDYREILVQPEQQQLGQLFQQQVAASSSSKSPQAGKQEESFQQQQHNMSEAELGEVQPEVQQQQEVSTEEPQQQAEQQAAQQQQQAEQQSVQQQQPEAPYIRLSNIATINSSSSANGSGSGEVKLMRIYVIDLDQKLVVGGGNAAQQQQQQQQMSVDETRSTAYVLPEASATSPRPAQNYSASSPLPPDSGYTKNYDLQTTYATTRQAARYEQQVAEQPVAQNQYQNHHQHQAQADGYVLLDRNALNANLSQIMAQYGAALVANQSSPGSAAIYLAANYSRANATSMTAAAANEDQPQAQLQQQPYAPLVLYEGADYSNTNVTSGAGSGAQVEPYGSLDSNSSTVPTSYLSSGQPHQIAAAFYPNAAAASATEAPVQMQPQPQQQQQQVYLAVPQYIAPQYNNHNNKAAPNNNQDNHGDYEQVAQVDEGQNNNSNYTSSKPTLAAAQPSLVVQAQQYYSLPMTRHEDKHHANNYKSQHLNVYHQEVAMYQQQQQTEPAQQQQQQAEPNFGPTTYKVTSASEQWRPVDYQAPMAVYSQMQPVAPSANPAHQQQQQQQQPANRPINGYRTASDHDVVSLNGYQQQQLAEQPAGLNQSDGQHASLNYQQQQSGGGSKSAGKQQPVYYVNKQQQSTGARYNGANDAPSQQVLQVPAHPSSYQQHQQSQASYNGTGEFEPTMSNEYAQPSANTGKQYQIESGEQQYGTAADHSNYPNSGGKLSQSAGESPQIPRPNSSGYRQPQQQGAKQRPAPAYLAAHGPPMVDALAPAEVGDEQALPVAGRPSRPQQQHRKRPRKARPQKPPHAAAAYMEEQSSEAVEEQQLGAAGSYQHHFHHQPQQLYGRPTSNVYQQHHYQPQPQMRPPQYQGGKGLLSWEVISSVASGAAKRLPSLSSFLAPFGGASNQPQRPQVVYSSNKGYGANSHPANYVKSAHYDRDVSTFHRPYPLRHMNSQHDQTGAVYSDLGPANEGGSGESGASSSEAIQQEAVEYAADLASASYGSDSSPSSSGSASSVQELAEGLEAVEVQETAGQHQLAGASSSRPQVNGTQQQQGGNEQQSGSIGGGKQQLPQVQAAKESDLAEISGNEGDQPRKSQQRPQVKAAKQPRRTRTQRKEAPKKKKSPVAQLDPEHAAVLSSIEEQLDGDSQSTVHLVGQSSIKGRPRRAKKAQFKSPSAEFISSSALALDDSALRPPLAPLPPMLASSSPASDGLAMSGPRPGLPSAALMESAPSGAGKLHFHPAEGSDEQAPMQPFQQHPQQRPSSQSSLSSVQIGQFRIVPQTQFVQSIFEPSRQMIGQYFKQYIGQLGQLGGQFAGR